MRAVSPKKKKKSGKRAQLWLFSTHFSKFMVFRTLHFLKRYMFLKILIENKAFYFSKRELRAVRHAISSSKKSRCSNYFLFKVFYCFSQRACQKNVLMITKVSCGSVERVMVIAFFQQTG